MIFTKNLSSFQKRRPLILSPWPVFRKLFCQIVFWASTICRRHKNTKKTLQNHAQTMEKTKKKTPRFSMSLFSYFNTNLRVLGLQNWSQNRILGTKMPEVKPFLSCFNIHVFTKWCSGGPQGRFGSPQESIWEGPGSIFSRFCLVFEHVFEIYSLFEPKFLANVIATCMNFQFPLPRKLL